MNDFAEKLKAQLEQVNTSLEQLTKAGRGLVTRVSEQSSKQFQQLVKTGEAQEKGGKTLSEQVKESFSGQFNGDIKASVEQFRLAALGLFTKAKSSSEQYFSELVKLGETQATPTPTKTKSAKKTNAVAA